MADADSHWKGNGLSDQPEAVRQQMLAQLAPAKQESRAARDAGTPPAAEAAGLQRWLVDPRVGPALVKLIDAIAQAAATAGSTRSEPTMTSSRGEMKREYILGPGHVEYFPTWSFWGRTFVRMINTGSVPTVVTINDDRFHLNPGEATTKDGQWAAFPIRVVNTSELPGSQVSVTVT
jgi:hypothetical protein